MRRKLVAGNWKMHGSKAANEALVLSLIKQLEGLPDTVDLLLCPPSPYLLQIADLLAATPIALGAQDLSPHRQGAHTGEVSASMLLDTDCRYVIVGHSERRAMQGETDALVAAKAQAAASAGLVPIVCVGETRDERERGEAEEVVGRQLDAVLASLGPQGTAGSVVAYEPVWAIGTGLTATPQQAQEMHAFIRARIEYHCGSVANSVAILYGGSVKPGNAAELFAMPDIDGGLVGGASLVAEDFISIARAAA